MISIFLHGWREDARRVQTICICNLFYFLMMKLSLYIFVCGFCAVFLDEACLRFHFTKEIMLDALMLKLGRMESGTNFRELCSSPWQALLGQRPKWSSDALSFPSVAMTCHTWLGIEIAPMENWFRGRQWPRKRWLSSRNNWENLWLSSCGTLTKRSSTQLGWFVRLTEEKTQTHISSISQLPYLNLMQARYIRTQRSAT